LAIEAFAGDIDREVKTAEVTARVEELLIVPEAAVMDAVPWLDVLARPPLLTVATELSDEVHIALAVRFCVVPLL
jgi:hypothetical protein